MKKSVKKLLTISLILGAVLLVGACKSQEQEVQNKPEPQKIKVGALFALSGPAADFGNLSLVGFQDAVEFFKEKNGSAVQVETYIEDTQADAKVAVSSTTKLFNVDQVKFAVVGMSAVSNAVAPVADQYQSLVITDAALYGITKDREFLLQNFMPSLNDIPKQINQNSQWKKVAIVHVNDDFGQVWSQRIKDQIKGKSVELFSFDKATKDFKTESLKIKEFQADVAVVLGYGPALNKVISDIQTQNADIDLVLYLACTLPGVLTDEKLQLESHFSYEYPFGENQEILAWIKKNNRQWSAPYAVAFENTLIALEAAKESNSDPVKAKEFLISNSLDGLFGEVRFSQDGSIERDLTLQRIRDGECGVVE